MPPRRARDEQPAAHAQPASPKLSTTERRVVELVVAGCTDDEVARRLFLSLKTVEWSLTKAYRKLRVRSRAELTSLLRPKSAEGAGLQPVSPLPRTRA